MEEIRSYRDLRVYNAAFQLQQQVFSISKTFPAEERYSLTDQIRRSSRSVGANIAEAWAKRRYEAHFTSKLTDVDGELGETRHWIDTADSCGYLRGEDKVLLLRQWEETAGMLGAMMRKADTFVPKDGPSASQ
jgi:four helix bundle protein